MACKLVPEMLAAPEFLPLADVEGLLVFMLLMLLVGNDLLWGKLWDKHMKRCGVSRDSG